ncbi:MAG: FimB/Mfa2 family fimbrial subunit [Muribaculaceae bacterium]|nr:FimB/Mfa2 family fimbrial subunit [Muribaculaceae bacterium]
MNFTNKKRNAFIRTIVKSLLVGLIMIGAASCESIYDKEQNCDPVYRLRFVFDMNMDYADAFSSKVNSVSLYVFEASTGDLKATYNESGAVLKKEGYTMLLDLNPGDYEFIAWCGLEGNEGHFNVSQEISNLRDIGCSITKDRDSNGKAIVDKELYSLFHGRLKAELPDDREEHLYTMSLVKNTNNVNLSIQEISGKSLDPSRFTVKLRANNGIMDYDNSVLDDEEIEYSPYRIKGGSAHVGTKGEEDNTHDLVLAEMSTARLIAKSNPSVEIYDNEKESTVYSIPLVKWALMLKSEQYSYMGDQEYLDREDEFNIILYVNETPDDADYLAVSVLINSWRIVLNNDSELS